MDDRHLAHTKLKPPQDLDEPAIHSFVVKIWLEHPAGRRGRRGPVVMRGRITHVPSRRYRHISKLSQIQAFIRPYVDERHPRAGLRVLLERMLRR